MGVVEAYAAARSSTVSSSSVRRAWPQDVGSPRRSAFLRAKRALRRLRRAFLIARRRALGVAASVVARTEPTASSRVATVAGTPPGPQAAGTRSRARMQPVRGRPERVAHGSGGTVVVVVGGSGVVLAGDEVVVAVVVVRVVVAAVVDVRVVVVLVVVVVVGGSTVQRWLQPSP